jgi:ORF6N domain
MPRKIASPASQPPVPVELVERRIYLIRGQKVMLDSDLAGLYQVPTKSLNLAVRRNAERFPADFMFQLSKEEFENLRFQFETSSSGHGGRRYPPHAFTELGVAMLSSVLNSERAVQMNIIIMRAFVRMRELLTTHKDLAEKIEKLERTQKQHGSILVAVVQDIQKLKTPPPQPPRRRIGFHVPGEK